MTHAAMRDLCHSWASTLNVRLCHVSIKPLTVKWASTFSDGRIVLSENLTKKSDELIEYVIVHELVHLLAPNHGRLFRAYLSAYLPDWERLEMELRRGE